MPHFGILTIRICYIGVHINYSSMSIKVITVSYLTRMLMNFILNFIWTYLLAYTHMT
jgi:hypothetical protein